MRDFSLNNALTDEQQALRRQLIENRSNTFFRRNGTGCASIGRHGIVSAKILEECDERCNVV